MLLFIDPRRPMGIGESLSGLSAFYITITTVEDWHLVEQSPDFRRLQAQDQETIKMKFPLCLERYHAIQSARFT